jgi:hypothetical protein
VLQRPERHERHRAGHARLGELEGVQQDLVVPCDGEAREHVPEVVALPNAPHQVRALRVARVERGHAIELGVEPVRVEEARQRTAQRLGRQGTQRVHVHVHEVGALAHQVGAIARLHHPAGLQIHQLRLGGELLGGDDVFGAVRVRGSPPTAWRMSPG